MPANQSTPEVTFDIRRNPESIWLSPICDDTADHGDGRTWASPAPEEVCEDPECGEPWVRYVREDLASPARGGDELRATAQFLSDRLDDLEWMDGDLESTLRDFMGHIDPAHARLKSALASTDMAGAGEACADCGGLNIGCPDGCAAPPVEGLTSGEGITPRRLLEDDKPDGYLESDHDFVMNNFDACLAWLEARTAYPKATATASVREDRAEVDRLSWLLFETWKRVDPDSGVAKHPTSYMANFADMARAVIADRALTDSGTAATIGGER